MIFMQDTMESTKVQFNRELRTFSNDFDIVVCGVGTAGICAAISVARAKAKVVLFECYGR